jgi:hypothetical protein
MSQGGTAVSRRTRNWSANYPSVAPTPHACRPSVCLPFILLALSTGCIGSSDQESAATALSLSSVTTPLATISTIGADSLSDSASIHRVQPEPDGGSIAFAFADPSLGVTQGLGLMQMSGGYGAQLVWPDSVATFWWSAPHELSFLAGTGQGVRVVVDVHAAQLEALEVRTGAQPPGATVQRSTDSTALRRAQAFVDSIRIQPQGTPQGSALHYRADTAILAPGDSFAAVHVTASDRQGTRVNPAWYVAYLPTGEVEAVDSLTGQSRGLLARAAAWRSNNIFYYAKERSIWQVQVSAK